MSLRTKLIRLAHENPELRDDLLPLLREASGKREAKKIGKLFKDLSKARAAFERAYKTYDKHLGYKGKPATGVRALEKIYKIWADVQKTYKALVSQVQAWDALANRVRHPQQRADRAMKAAPTPLRDLNDWRMAGLDIREYERIMDQELNSFEYAINDALVQMGHADAVLSGR